MKTHKLAPSDDLHPTGKRRGGTVAAIIGAILGAVLGWVIGTAIATDDYVGGMVGALLGVIIGWMIGKALGRRKHTEVAETQPSTAATKVTDLEPADASLSRRTDPAASSAAAQAANRADRSEAVRVPLAEERLEVDKRELEAGLVRLRKVVKTEIVHLPVELRREEIIVEKVEPGQTSTPASGDGHTFEHHRGDEIVIPLVKEEAVIQKESKVFSEVHVHKVTRSETETIREQVRREEVILDQADESGVRRSSEV